LIVAIRFFPCALGELFTSEFFSNKENTSIDLLDLYVNGRKAAQGYNAAELGYLPAMNDPDSPMLAIVDRLGRLEGLITGLQNVISQSQTSTTAFMTRVEALEKRQVELERNMVKAADIQSLVEKVDRLVTSDASRKGGTDATKWSVTQIIAFGALIIALLSLIGVGVNRDLIQQGEQQKQESQS
jgi:hypothetical protein